MDRREFLINSAALAASAALLPEQMGVWSQPLEYDSPEATSCNMANAMLGRIHQSGPLPRLKPASLAQVRHGIEIYKHHIRRYIPQFVPFYPLGMPVLTRPDLPAALGMRAGEKQFLAVWRRSGPEGVHIASRAAGFHLLYPRDLGIVAIQDSDGTTVRFPSPNMACILST